MLQPYLNKPSSILSSIASFLLICPRRKSARKSPPFLFAATLVALKKKSGEVRPIAVGFTLRRLVAKVAGYPIVDEMADVLSQDNWAMVSVGGLKLLFMLPVNTSKFHQINSLC